MLCLFDTIEVKVATGEAKVLEQLAILANKFDTKPTRNQQNLPLPQAKTMNFPSQEFNRRVGV